MLFRHLTQTLERRKIYNLPTRSKRRWVRETSDRSFCFHAWHGFFLVIFWISTSKRTSPKNVFKTIRNCASAIFAKFSGRKFTKHCSFCHFWLKFCYSHRKINFIAQLYIKLLQSDNFGNFLCFKRQKPKMVDFLSTVWAKFCCSSEVALMPYESFS